MADALDAWWTQHGNGQRISAVNGCTFDSALNLFNSLKALEAQGRAPEGYDIDNPVLIDAAKSAQIAVDASWIASLTRTVTVPAAATVVVATPPTPEETAAHGEHAQSFLSKIGQEVTPENIDKAVSLITAIVGLFAKKKS